MDIGVEPEKQICVVVDTNRWRSSLLLNAEKGAKLLHFLYRLQGKLGLPEVVEQELHKHVSKAAQDAVSKTNQGLREIRAIMGSSIAYTAPSSEEIANSIKKRLQELQDLIIREPVTEEHKELASDRVKAGLPPNSRKEQWADSLIWQAVLELGQQYSVHFISWDRAFYQGHNYELGLAKALQMECKSLSSEVKIYPDLDSCVEALMSLAPVLNKEAIAKAISPFIEAKIEADAAGQRLAIGGLCNHNLTAYFREDYHLIELDFELTYEATELAEYHGIVLPPFPDLPRSEARIIVVGGCLFSMSQAEANDIRLDKTNYYWLDKNSSEEYRGAAFAHLSTIIQGKEPDVPHKIKKLLSH